MHRVNDNHQNDCRPLVAFNSHQRGHYSTFQQQKQQRKLTFLNVGRESNSQDETIEISSSPIISKISSIALKITSSKKAKGRAILLLVSFLYGTTLRAIYASDGAPTASVLSLVRQCLSVLTFIPIIASVNNRNNAAEMEQKREEDSGIKLGNTNIEEDESNNRPMWLAAAELAFWNCGAQVSKTCTA